MENLNLKIATIYKIGFVGAVGMMLKALYDAEIHAKDYGAGAYVGLIPATLGLATAVIPLLMNEYQMHRRDSQIDDIKMRREEVVTISFKEPEVK